MTQTKILNDNWTLIQKQVDTLLNPKWIKNNLPFLEPNDMKDAMLLLGLRMNDGKGLFEAEWFNKGHDLEPALNAKPSEFAATIDKLIDDKLFRK